jgi:cytochrome b involved in lipid metabolism
MSSYHIVTEDCSFEFLPSCNISKSVLMIRRLSMESLRGLARLMNSLAERIEENNDDKVFSEWEKNEKANEKSNQVASIEPDSDQPVRDRSGSVDSGIGDWEVDPETGLEVISLDEVSYHCTMEDGWMVIYDKVYEVTEYLMKHPGGEDVMMEYLGYDATMAFRGVGHSKGALRMLEKYVVGILPMDERLCFSQ